MPILAVRDVIFRFTELFELAAKVAGSETGDNIMVLKGSKKDLAERTLWLEPRRGGHFMTTGRRV